MRNYKPVYISCGLIGEVQDISDKRRKLIMPVLIENKSKEMAKDEVKGFKRMFLRKKKFL